MIMLYLMKVIAQHTESIQVRCTFDLLSVCDELMGLIVDSVQRQLVVAMTPLFPLISPPPLLYISF
jgi:hypothetical protein